MYTKCPFCPTSIPVQGDSFRVTVVCDNCSKSHHLIKCGHCDKILLSKGHRRSREITSHDNLVLYYRFCESCDSWDLYDPSKKYNTIMVCNCGYVVDETLYNKKYVFKNDVEVLSTTRSGVYPVDKR